MIVSMDNEIVLDIDAPLAQASQSMTNPAMVFCARISKNSRRVAIADLGQIASYFGENHEWNTFPWHKLKYEHTQFIRTMLSQKYPAVTVNRHLSMLRSVLKEARKLRLMTFEECGNACDVVNMKADPGKEAKGRALEPEEVSKLVGACDLNTLSGARDGCLLALLFGGGLRRSEASSAALNSLRDGTGVSIKGKGGKTRYVPLPKDAVLLLKNWLHLRGDKEGPILMPFDMNGNPKYGEPLCESGVYSVLMDIANRAGVENVTPHDARRTRITQMLSAGQSIAIVAKIAGHSEVTTTAKYDRSTHDAMREAANKVDMI